MSAFYNTFYYAAAVLITVFIGILTFFKWKYTYWQRRDIPSFTPTIPFGNMKDMVKQKKNFGVIVKEIYEEFKRKGYRHAGLYIFARAAYIPIDREIIKLIMLKDFNNFTDRRLYYNEKDDPLSANLVSLEGEKWKNLRQKLTPTFTTGQLKNMFSTLKQCGENLEEYLKQHTQEPLDSKDILGRFTTDVIATCAFGLECNALQHPESDFRKYGKLIFEQSQRAALKLLTTMIFPRNFLRFIGFKSTRNDVSTFFMNTVKEIVHYRETNNIHRKDFMHLLLQLKNQENLTEQALSLEEIAAQAFLFYTAGFESSSTAMNYALLELAQNQDIQEKVREEIRTVLQQYNGKISYDAIMEMPYLSNVIDETLRMYPPGTTLGRICTEDYQIPGSETIIEKGTQVLIPVLGLHKDPDFFPNPEIFNPDRFKKENKTHWPSIAYLPFGDGPRNCIGSRFGLLQSKVALVSVLRTFQFTVHPKTKLPIVLEPSLSIATPKNRIWLQVKKLN